MKTLWLQLTQVLEQLGTDVCLQPPAARGVIPAAEKALGIIIPADLQASLRIHNGQAPGAEPLLGHWLLLPVAEIQQAALALQTQPPKLTPELTAAPEEFAKALRWLPFAANGAGDYLCLDLHAQVAETGKGRKKPQTRCPVHLLSHESELQPLLAPDFQSWLQDLLATLRINALAAANAPTQPFTQPTALTSDASSALAVPEMAALVQWVGMPIESGPAQSLLSLTHQTRKGSASRGPTLLFSQTGIEVQLSKKGRIEVIQLYIQATAEFAAYKGALLQGLAASDGCQSTRHKLGPPTRSGPQAANDQPLGGWDRFDSAQVCIRIGYQDDTTGIWLISLMAPDVAP